MFISYLLSVQYNLKLSLFLYQSIIIYLGLIFLLIITNMQSKNIRL